MGQSLSVRIYVVIVFVVAKRRGRGVCDQEKREGERLISCTFSF